MNGVSQYKPMLQARYTHAECRIPWAGFLKSCMNRDSIGSTFEAAIYPSVLTVTAFYQMLNLYKHYTKHLT